MMFIGIYADSVRFRIHVQDIGGSQNPEHQHAGDRRPNCYTDHTDNLRAERIKSAAIK